MTKERKPVSEWRNMNREPKIAKEWQAFTKAKDALVAAIRDKFGADTPVSFNRYSFGIVDAKHAGKGAVTTIDPAVLAALTALLVKQQGKATGKRK